MHILLPFRFKPHRLVGAKGNPAMVGLRFIYLVVTWRLGAFALNSYFMVPASG